MVQVVAVKKAKFSNLLHAFGVEHQLRQHRVNFRKHVTPWFALELTHKFLCPYEVGCGCKRRNVKVPT